MMRKLARLCSGTLILFATCLTTGCQHATPQPTTSPVTASSSAAAPPSATLASLGIDKNALDQTVDPCQDFYQYACGSWLKSTNIPADETFVSRVDQLADPAWLRPKTRILNELAAAPEDSSDVPRQRLRRFFLSCEHVDARGADGDRATARVLELTGGYPKKVSLAHAVASLHRVSIKALFYISHWQFGREKEGVVATLDSAPLYLGSRDAYLGQGEREAKLRASYRELLTRTFQLARRSESAAKQAAEDVLSIETQLATLTKTALERRNFSSMRHRVTREGIKKSMPSFDWDEYFRALGFPDMQLLSVTSPDYFAGVEKLLHHTNPEALAAYLAWLSLNELVVALPKPFRDQGDIMDKLMTGSDPESREDLCADLTEGALPDDLGRSYVAARFSASARADATAMAEHIKNAMVERLNTVPWIDAETREKAKDKIRATIMLVGYPDVWKDYDVALTEDDFLSNILATNAAYMTRTLATIGKPVRRDEWTNFVTYSDASYTGAKNRFTITAAALQPPAFDSKNALLSYASAGRLCGHELGHAFDNVGGEYDGQGQHVDWWTPGARAGSESAASRVERTYSAYEALPGVFLDGRLTRGENMADIAGLKLGLDAYEASIADRPRRRVEDYDEEQLFFLAAAQSSCSKLREPIMRSRLTSDPHSPAKYRVNGGMSERPEFATAFHCSAGSPMNPVPKCGAW